MSGTLANSSYYIGAYNSSGNLDSTAFKFFYTVSYGDYNVLTNKTPVTVKWTFTNATSGWRYNYAANTVIARTYLRNNKTNTEQLLATKDASVHTAGATDTLCNWTGEVEHNADGTLDIRVRFDFDGGESKNALPRKHNYSYPTSTTWYSLPTIPRASGVTAPASASIGNNTGNYTYTITPQISAYHKTVWTLNGTTKTVNHGQFSAATNINISYADILAAMTNTASATLTLNVYTYSDSGYSNQLGDAVVKTAAITIDTSAIKPSIGSVTVSYRNGCPIGSYIVAGYSTFSTNVSGASGAYGSVIANTIFTADKCTINQSTGVSNVMPTSQNDYTVTVTATVVDSRGATASKSATVTVLGYRPPVVNLYAYRCNAQGAEDLAGGYSKGNGSATVGSLSAQNNRIATVTRTAGSSTFTNDTPTALSESSSIVYTITATDSMGVTVSTSVTVSAAAFPIDLYQEGNSVGAAFGTVAEAGKVKSALPIEVNNNSSSGYVRIREDGEGGTIDIASPNGKEFEIDAHNDWGLRVYGYSDEGTYHSAYFDRRDGSITASKFKGQADSANIADESYRLKNYYNSRQASANLETNTGGQGDMINFKATSSMTTGKPIMDGHIIQSNWDTSGGYDTQLFVPNAPVANPDTGHMQFRGQNGGNWEDWVTVLDSQTKLFKTTTVSTPSTTVGATSTKDMSVSVGTQTGYTPVGIIGWFQSGSYSTYANIYRIELVGTTVNYSVRNLNGSSSATVSLKVVVLWVKTGLI